MQNGPSNSVIVILAVSVLLTLLGFWVIDEFVVNADEEVRAVAEYIWRTERTSVSISKPGRHGHVGGQYSIDVPSAKAPMWTH